MGTVNDTSSFCRSVEAYLCRKNDGHLVRVVGPAFEQVCSWAERGIPLNVVYQGIDRYFERYYAKGPRRRPIRIEFCEADVFDVFDEWRRAVGLPGSPASRGLPGEDTERASATGRRRESLSAHLERVVARLTALRSSSSAVPGFSRTVVDAAIDDVVREIDTARASARGLRGEARLALLDRLRELERRLTDAARAACDEQTLAQIRAEADAELAPFRDRMPADAYQQSQRAAVDRLLRERVSLPVISLDA